MSNYNETNITGQQWTRCHQVIVSNPLGGTPSVQFAEEAALSLGDKTLTSPAGVLQVPFDPAKVVPLLDPETLEPTGHSMTYGQLYLGMFGAYIQAATEQDTEAANRAQQEAEDAERIAQEQAAEAQRREDEAKAKEDAPAP